jgi:hypothetical protein
LLPADGVKEEHMRTRLVVVLLCILSVLSVEAQATKSKFLKTSDAIGIHYREAGSGRPILFIPGWTMPAWIWQSKSTPSCAQA